MKAESTQAGEPVDLPRFTFDSLYFCATPVELFRGESFLTAVNRWYMPLIRAGWAVPLCFLIDLATLVLRPDTGFRMRWKEESNSPDVQALSLRYYQSLQKLRRQAVFARLAALVAQTHEAGARNRVVFTFIRSLVSHLGAREFRRAYSFNTRDLKLLAATPTAEGLRGMRLTSAGESIEGAYRIRDPSRIQRRNEFGPVIDQLSAICDFLAAHSLQQLVAPEDELLWEFAARDSGGLDRVDYRLLYELFHARQLEEIDECFPRPKLVHDVIPTDTFQIEGPIGGYVDITRKPFEGRVDGVVPGELALSRHRPYLMHKLLNEGVLHYVRENIEYVERELRLLFCFVVDNHHSLLRLPESADPALGKGLTPYIRARALVALLIEDLARFLPRREVQVDCALYLWSPAEQVGARGAVDIFSWSRDEAAHRNTFLTGMVRQSPFLFHHRAGARDSDRDLAIDPDPLSFLTRRSRERRYHGRHMVFLTSSRTRGELIPEGDPGLIGGDYSSDTIFVVECDVDRQTLGFSAPTRLAEARGDWSSSRGQLSEERLRRHFIQSVLRKAEGRSFRLEDLDLLEYHS